MPQDETKNHLNLNFPLKALSFTLFEPLNHENFLSTSSDKSFENGDISDVDIQNRFYILSKTSVNRALADTEQKNNFLKIVGYDTNQGERRSD